MADMAVNGSTAGAGADGGTGAPDASSQNINPDGSVTLNIGQHAPSDDVKLFNEFIPNDEYRKKEWVQNLAKAENPRLELFKQIEHKDSLIGKQTAVNLPAQDASPEQWKAFFKSIGVPDTAEGYKYDGLKAEGEDKQYAELINKARSESYVKAAAAKAHARGLRPDQFAGFMEDLEKTSIELNKTQIAEFKARAEAENKDVETRSKEIFGDRRDQVIKNAEKMMELIPANVKALAQNLSPDQRIVLAALYDSTHQRYVKEDSVSVNSGTHSGSSVEDMQAERYKIMESKAYQDPRDPGHKAAVAKKNDLNNRMRAAGR